jgi:hypothetical protein
MFASAQVAALKQMQCEIMRSPPKLKQARITLHFLLKQLEFLFPFQLPTISLKLHSWGP